ncbi:MAG: hypothetical protein ACUBOA_05195 [Candidatus Loosdrechtia sp.]|uniref:hypothetical protein n=1 Tax=Candidatus Loosdrechtia sp. TaxID=3101272 RepID=UPI003A7578BE|nr:MAG: hypothetical protein QY305_14020 [Candidatus Jettenia sp. AMX2]
MFKNMFICFTLLAVPFASFVFADSKEVPAVIQWEKGLGDAIARAKETGKPVLLDVFMIG